jgi:hypothetical protein
MNGPPPNDGGGKVQTNSCFSPSRACAPRVLLLQHPWPPRLLCGSVSLGPRWSSCCHGPASINRAGFALRLGYGWERRDFGVLWILCQASGVLDLVLRLRLSLCVLLDLAARILALASMNFS